MLAETVAVRKVLVITLQENLAMNYSAQNSSTGGSANGLNLTSTFPCIPPAVHNFPSDLLSEQQRENGGILIHIFATIYIFGCLAHLCDRYFVPALETFTERMKMQPEVAGASFMAIGNSAPELFTSLIGVYVSEDDVGVGTVVGSAVFNILFVIGGCILVSPAVLHVEVYPIVRDASFYVVSLIPLAIVCMDGKVDWYDALILVLLYGLYMLIIYNSRKIEEKFYCLFPFIARTEASKDEIQLPKVGDKATDVDVPKNEHKAREAVENPSEVTYPFYLPRNKVKKVMWVIGFPIIMLFWITIPDASKLKKQKWFPVTFVMCMLYMGSFSYALVYFVTIIGFTFGIPDIVMGLVVIACGCNPDAIATILIAKHGKGRMSISNCMGANIFHILLSLGIPWLSRTLITHHGESVDILSGSIKFTILMLIGSVVSMIFIFVVSRWRLRWPAGFLLILAYVCIMTIACLFEMNVFGSYNLPTC